MILLNKGSPSFTFPELDENTPAAIAYTSATTGLPKGVEMGELLWGPWIAGAYYKDPERSNETFKDGWYYSNDIVTVDEEGYILVQDRAKDLIKSGGEWISSVELENKIMAHPAVVEAAVIAIPDAKWQERPLACVVLKEEEKGKISGEDIINFLKDKVAKWWLPNRVIFIDEVPKTSVGKFDKKSMRQKYFQAWVEGQKSKVEGRDA